MYRNMLNRDPLNFNPKYSSDNTFLGQGRGVLCREEIGPGGQGKRAGEGRGRKDRMVKS